MSNFGRVRPLRLALLLMLSACATAQPGSPRTGPVLEELRFEGVTREDEKKIKAGIVTRQTGFFPWSPTRRFDPLAFEVDLRRIETWYRGEGYYRARVTGTRVARSGKDRVEVTVTVDRGTATRIARLELRGLDALPADLREQVLVGLPLAEGKTLRVSDYERERDELELRLRGAGHARAQVNGKVDVFPERSQAEVRLEVVPGPLFRFGAIETRGLRIISDDKVRAVARRALPVGERYSPKAFENAQSLVYQLRVFDAVRIALPEQVADPGNAPVRVVAQERAANSLGLGGGIGIERGVQQVQLSLNYTNVGLLGGASLLSWQNELALRTQRTLINAGQIGPSATSTLELTFPELFRATDLTLRGSFGRETREAYTANTGAAQLGLPVHVRANAALVPSVGARAWFSFQPVALSAPVGPKLSPDCPAPCRVVGPSLDLTIDGRDDPLSTRRGYLALLNLEYDPPLTGGQFNLLRAEPELRGYLPAGSDWVLAGRLRLGAVFALGSSTAVPIVARLFGGGSTGHRGFGPEQLSPLIEDAAGRVVPVGGAGLWLATAEARLRFAGKWGLVFFTDWGDVTVDPLRFDFGAAQLAVGLGLRLYSVAGPVRLDVAWRPGRHQRHALNTGAPVEHRALDYFALSISLGEAF